MIRSGAHVYFEAMVARDHDRACRTIALALTLNLTHFAEAMRDFERRFAVAAQRAAKAWGEALRPLVEMERRMREEGQGD